MTIPSEDEILNKITAIFDRYSDLNDLNAFLSTKTGIRDFFHSKRSLEEFRKFLTESHSIKYGSKELGDFQTPNHLTDKICNLLADKGVRPDIILESTCGQGNFIVSALKSFPSVRYIYCVDIQRKYEYPFKLNILKYSLERDINARIEFHFDNIFTHRFSEEFVQYLEAPNSEILILGNPPWATSSKLSVLNSTNLPIKSNIKRLPRGIEALMGKSNFDIAEFIILQMLKQFSRKRGKLAMLCKTSVIRNIVRDMLKLSLTISNLEALLIDARKEFNINTEGALFLADLGSGQQAICTVSSLYNPKQKIKKFGWVDDKFVSDIELYQKYGLLDGQSPFEWRQGVKHDASKVMVLSVNTNGILTNGFGEVIDVEEDRIYPFIKGSELRKPVIMNASKKIIITQTSLLENTDYIAMKYPKLWRYLTSHSAYLDNRKSKIYQGRPRFSLFGIGEYSFKPYKVAISGLYKSPNFSLLLPIDGKPAMLDDTCYYLSFNDLNVAIFTWTLLNSQIVKDFLNSIAFLDAMRSYTKEVLMRVNIVKVAEQTSFNEVLNFYERYLAHYLEEKIKEKDYRDFQDFLKLTTSRRFH